MIPKAVQSLQSVWLSLCALLLLCSIWPSGLANIVSVTLIYIGIIYSAIQSVSNVGGWDAVLSKLPNPEVMGSPVAGLAFATILGWIIVMITQTITAQGPVQIACGAKNVKAARNGYVLAGLMIFPVGFICAVLGVVCKAMYPEMPVAQAALAMPKVVMTLDPLAGGVTLAALWAADVSTACTILLGAATLFSNDIYKRFINPAVAENKFVIINRLSVFAVGLITLWFAFNAAGIVKTMIAGLSMTCGLTCVFFFTMFAPGLCRRSSAFWTTLVSLIGIALWFVPGSPLAGIKPLFANEVIYFEWPICIITFLLVAMLDKNKIKEVVEVPEEDE